MTDRAPRKDLIVLAADKNIEFTIRGFLRRSDAIRVRRLEFDVFVHPEHDPGCLLKSHDFLRAFHRQYERAAVIFDREGCGAEARPTGQLELEVRNRLAANGWGDRAAAIVLDPELEIWVWADSPAVDDVLGWTGRYPALRDWLRTQGYLLSGEFKPQQPKKAFEHALRLAPKARSSALFLSLAERVDTDRCTDEAFARLRRTLESWFPRGTAAG